MSLKRLFSVVLSLSLGMSPVSFAQSVASGPGRVADGVSVSLTSEERKAYEDVRSFLVQMGYEDFSLQAQATLDSEKILSPETREILQTNRDRLAIVSQARDLTAYLMARMEGRFDDVRAMDRLAQVTGRLLSFGLKGLPDELPPEIKNIRDTKEREMETDKFLRLYIESAVNQAVADLRADLLSVLYAPADAERLEHSRDPRFLAEKETLSRFAERIITAKHAHLELTQSRFTGRAFALALVRKARLAGRSDLEKRLREVVLNHGEVLDNYISEKFLIAPGLTAHGDLRTATFELKTGDLLTAYSRATEESTASVKFYPQGWLNRAIKFARFELGLQSVRSLIPWENRIIAKRLRGEKLTWTETLVSALMNFPVFRRGYNTVGLVDVKTDPQTGLKATWVMRSVGNDRRGGVQFEDPRNFMMPGIVDRVGHSRLQAETLVNLNKSLDFSRVDFGKTGGFDVRITPSDRAALLDRGSQDARWVEREVGPRAVSMMKEMMVGKDAIGFHWGAMVESRALSSGQAVVAAYAAGAGLEIQTMHNLVKPGSAVPLVERRASQNVRVVAPSAWTWDSAMATTMKVEFPKNDPQARVMEFYGATRPAIDARIYAVSIAGSRRIQMKSAELDYVVGWARTSAEYQNLMAKSLTQENRDRWQNLDSISERLARTANDHRLSAKDMREFLFEMGFNDWAQEIESARKNGEAFNEAARVQQERNIKSYGVINSAREMAIFLMERVQGRLQTKEGQIQIAEMAALLLAQQPQFPVKKYPPEILALPEAQREVAMDRYLERMLRQTMDEHSRNLVADLLWHLHGDQALEAHRQGTLDAERGRQIEADTRRLYDLSTTIVERMYMDFQVGQTRFAGRAFLALLARQAEVREQSSAVSLAKDALRRSGLRYENFIGDTWVFSTPDRKGDLPVKVQTLTYVLNRLMDATSAAIPWGAQPDVSLKAKAQNAGLIGNPLSALFPVDPSSVKEGYGLLSQMKDQATYKVLNEGFSHIGYVVMKESSKSQVKMSWVVDNYPHVLADASMGVVKGSKFNAGGARFVGLEQFYLTSHHSRFLIADHDPVQFHRLAMEQIRKTGIPRTGAELFPFETHEMKVSPDGEPLLPAESERRLDPWKVEASQSTLNDLYSTRNPLEFWKKYQRLVGDGLIEDIRRGLIFQWITPMGLYFKGGSYCSSYMPIASLRKAGLNPEFKPSRWIGLLKIFEMAYVVAEKRGWKSFTENETVKDLVKMARMGIIAPSSLAAQEYVTKYSHVMSPAQEIHARMKDDWAQRVAKKPAARAAVDGALETSQRNRFVRLKLDASEVRAMSFEVEHGVDVRMGRIGMAIQSLKDVMEKANKEGLLEESAPVRHQDRVRPTAPLCSKVLAG